MESVLVTRDVQITPRLYLPQSSYGFSVCDFPYDFRQRAWVIVGYEVCVYS